MNNQLILDKRKPQLIFYTVYRKRSSQLSPSSPDFKVVGAYSDVRDAVQAIVTAHRRRGGNYWIETTTVKPRHWLHPTRYKNDDLN
jgi:hypothetical protein